MAPTDSHFSDPQTLFLCQEKNLRVKSEALNLLPLKNGPGRLSIKQFEAALSVLEAQPGEQPDEEVKDFSRELAHSRLVYLNQARVNSARAHDYRIAFPGGSHQLAGFFDRCRKVGIGEKDGATARLKRSVTDAIPLAAISPVREWPEVGIPLGQLPGELERPVRRTIIHDDHFPAERLGTKPGIDSLQRLGKTAGFVVGGNDDGEIDVQAIHPNRIFR